MSSGPTDNEEERLARIDQLVEEYRIKHEDLETYLRAVRNRSRAVAGRARDRVVETRRLLNRRKKLSR